MPITEAALILGLTAGVKSYDTQVLGWSNWTLNNTVSRKLHNVLLMQAFQGTQVIDANNLTNIAGTNGAKAGTTFSTPVSTGVAGPHFRAKSHLQAPVVMPIATSGTVTKIAFALVSANTWISVAPHSIHFSLVETTPGVNAERKYTLAEGNEAIAIPSSTGDNNAFRGDVFMVITVHPAIAVTAGGYLTIKGFKTGQTGSDSFTFVTLQSGA